MQITWCKATRCRLVALLFYLVWVPGKQIISLLGLDLKSLGTIEIVSVGQWWEKNTQNWWEKNTQNLLSIPHCRKYKSGNEKALE